MSHTFFNLASYLLEFMAFISLRAITWISVSVILILSFWVLYFLFVFPFGWVFTKLPQHVEKFNLPRKIGEIITKSQGWNVVVALGILCALPFAVIGPHESIGRIFKATQNVRVFEHSEIRQYKLLAITNPKHVYVTIEDVKTGNVYQQYVSKHCSAKNDIGDIYNLEISHYHMSKDPSSRSFTFNNLERSFCSQ